MGYYKLDLALFLKLPQEEMSNFIIKFLVDQKISKVYKNLMFSTLKHACEMNDVILNWKKMKKFIKTEKTGNEANGRDRGYTHQEIQTILDFCDQRIKNVFLLLTSTGIHAGALHSLRIGDLEKIDYVYKVTVYSGDKEEYLTFCTPECAKEIDTNLEFRKRHGEKITGDSYLIVKKFNVNLGTIKVKPFGCDSI